MNDVVIVGAGPAGLQAALVLARAGRAVVVVDGGPGRNAPSAHAHNVFTRDGTPPDHLRRIGREQAERYGAQFVEGRAVGAEADEARTAVHLADGTTMSARRLLLATGVEDVLPDVPGLAEAWGDTVAHCPYCHGYELRGRPTAVLGSGAKGVHLSGLLLGWTRRVTLCCGPGGVTDDERRSLEAMGVAVDARVVATLELDEGTVRGVTFRDGGRLEATALYVQPDQRPSGPLPDALGLERTEAGLIRTDEFMRTSAPGVWACGDVVSPMQAVQTAASSGFAAGAFLNHDLVMRGARFAGPATT